MSTPTRDEILTPPTIEEAMDGIVLAELRQERDGVQLPVSAWLPGDPYRALAWGVANAFREGAILVATFAAATFGEFVGGFSTPPSGMEVTAWVDDFVHDRFGTTRIRASSTKRTLRFTNTSGATYTISTAGRVIVEFVDTGNRYVNDAAFTVPASTVDVGYGAGVIEVTFRSEYAIDSSQGRTYLDASDVTIRLITAQYPGVTVSNPAGTFTEVSQTGSGTGTVTPSGTPAAGFETAYFAVRIDTSGQTTVATWSYRIQRAAGDTGWVSAGAAAAVANASSSGVTITLANGAGTPSFAAKAVYSFSTPGTDVTVRGRDLETPQEAVTRGRAILPLLDWTKDAAGNFVPPTTPPIDGFVAMTLTAFPEEVKVCYVRTGDVNDEVKIFVAGQGATLSAATIARVQSFWDLFAGLTNYPVVASPATEAITLGAGTVTVKQGLLTAAQRSIQNAIATYLAGLDPNRPLGVGDGSTIKVRRDYLIALITTTPGVTDFTDDTFTVNGATTDLLLTADNMPTWTQILSSVFTWATE